MKLLLLIILNTFSTNIWAMNLSKKLQVIEINYNEKNKNYDIFFEELAGIYHADKSHLSCLEKSIEKKIMVKVEFMAIGLKVVKCD